MDPSILIFNTPLEAAVACGDRTLELLNQARHDRGAPTLAVSGGSTPRLMFEAMTKRPFDWSGVELFQVDERCVPPDDPQSNFRMLQEALLRGVAIENRRVHRIQGELAPEDAVRLYVEDIRRTFQISGTSDLPAFDVIQRGMGPDAHTASLFPDDPIIEERAGIAAAVENLHLEKSMRHRVTLLRGVLEHARHTLCLVTGEDKAEALWKVLRTPFDPIRKPAQIASENMVWFLDKAAAAKL